MTEQHDTDEIFKMKQELKKACQTKMNMDIAVSKTSKALKRFIPVMNMYADHVITTKNTAETDALCVLMCNAVTHLMHGIRCNIGALLKRHKMRASKPMSVGACVFIDVSHMLSILEVFPEESFPDKFAFRPLRTTSVSIASVLEQYLAINSVVHVCDYSLSTCIDAYNLLAERWDRLTFSRGIERYILGLLHRMAILVAKPHPEKILDDPKLCKQIAEGIFCMNADGIRYAFSPCIRMWHMMTLFRTTPHLSGSRRNLYPLQRRLNEEITRLAAVDETKKEVTRLCEKSLIYYGELETFIRLRIMEAAEPYSIRMCKIAESQIFITNMYSQIELRDGLIDIEESDPRYRMQIPMSTHIFYMTAKLYAFDAMLNSRFIAIKARLEFMETFVVDEHDFVVDTTNYLSNGLPMVIIIQNRTVLLYDLKFYVCTSTEQTLMSWLELMISEKGGKVNGVDFTSVMKDIINAVDERKVEIPDGGTWSIAPFIKGKQ